MRLLGKQLSIYIWKTDDDTGGINLKRKTLFIVFSMILMLCLTLNSYGKEEPKKITVSATKRVSYEPNGDTLVEGDATIFYGDITIKSNIATINKEKQTVNINEKFVLEQGNYVSLKGNKLFGDFMNQYIEVNGQAILVRNEDGSKIEADYIKIFTESENFEAKGQIKITRGDQVATSDSCVYDNVKNVVDLFGNVVIKGAAGESISSAKASINLNNESFVAEAKDGEKIVITIEF